MRFFVMLVTAVCTLFLIKLRWPKKKNFYKTNYFFGDFIWSQIQVKAVILSQYCFFFPFFSPLRPF